jgi:hypothetical protein
MSTLGFTLAVLLIVRAAFVASEVGKPREPIKGPEAAAMVLLYVGLLLWIVVEGV